MNRRRGWPTALALLVAASALPAQDPAAAFDEAAAAWRAATTRDDRARLAAAASDAFLRLPVGPARAARLSAGADATLAAGRTDLALELSTPPDGAFDSPADDALLPVHLRALARTGALPAFVRLAGARRAAAPAVVDAALAEEEGRLLPLAAAALRTPDRPAGRETFRLLAELEPRRSYRAANFGLCLRQIGDVAAAEAVYRRGLERAPDDLELWNDYGLMLRANGRVDEARRAFWRAVAIDRARPAELRHTGPAIANLMHLEALSPGAVTPDPVPAARDALAARPDAVLLTRVWLDVHLRRLQSGRTPADGAVAPGATGR